MLELLKRDSFKNIVDLQSFTFYLVTSSPISTNSNLCVSLLLVRRMARLDPIYRFRLTTAILVKTVFFGHVFFEYGYSPIPVTGASMLPTFEVIGDWLLVSKKYRRGKGIEVGDIVQFDSVVDAGAGVVKRVLGLEGDYVLRNTPGAKYDDMIQVSYVLFR